MDVECAVDAYRHHPFAEMIEREVEVVNFWAAPQSDSPKVSERLIGALSTRMNFEELRMLPKVVFVGMKRAVSHSGSATLYPDDLYHVACARLAPVRVYGYQRTSQGTGVGQIYVYVDMVCGSCRWPGRWTTVSGTWTTGREIADTSTISSRCLTSSKPTSQGPSAWPDGSSMANP